MIKLENITKKFKDNIVLNNINIEFDKGKIYHIKGVNGSGKTVLLKSICGFMKLTSGKIFQENEEIIFNKRFIKNAGIIIETPQFLSQYTLIENLKMLKLMSKNITDDSINCWLDYYDLGQYRDVLYKNLSLGTKQKLSLIQAFIHNPSVLILDEPTNALDTKSVELTINKILENKENKIVIISSHINSTIKDIFDKEFLIENGEINI